MSGNSGWRPFRLSPSTLIWPALIFGSATWTGRTGLVLDEERLVPARLQPGREQPRHDVRPGRGRERNDDPHRALGDPLGERAERRGGRSPGKRSEHAAAERVRTSAHENLSP